jgi:hypothetical protein
VKILVGAPDAYKNPKRAVRRFYRRMFGVPDPGSAFMAAFVSLSDKAKEGVEDWEGLRTHWDRHTAEAGTMSMRRLRIERPEAGRARYRMDIRTVGNTGTREYTAEGELAQVGERWYLTDGTWNTVQGKSAKRPMTTSAAAAATAATAPAAEDSAATRPPAEAAIKTADKVPCAKCGKMIYRHMAKLSRGLCLDCKGVEQHLAWTREPRQ